MNFHILLIECGYDERREEASYTLFFRKQGSVEYPILINVFYTTRGVMTKLSHPKSGYNQLWRSSAYDSEDGLRTLFNNPRKHTGKGYRSADKAKRGCILCGMLKEKNDFSKNQWRKDPGDSKCTLCLQDAKVTGEDRNSNVNRVPQVTTNLPVLFLGIDEWFVNKCRDAIKDESVVITTETLLNDSSQAKISNVSQKFRGIIITDGWFDVDGEYQSISNSMFRMLKDMYQSGGTVIIAATMGVFSVPRQISKLFGFECQWEFGAYTTMSMVTTSLGREILEDAFPDNSVYTKANFIQTSPDECLFEQHIDPEDYEDYSDDEDIPIPIKDKAPIVRHCGQNGGRVFYFGFVSEDGFKWGDIIMKLMHSPSQSSSQTESHGNKSTSSDEINYECIPCDDESCTNYGASICCPTCKMAFYCSEACQRRSNRAHANDCRVGASMVEMHAMHREPTEVEKRGRAMAAMLAGRQDFKGRLLQAEYWLMEENWGGAFETYQGLYMKLMERSPAEQREVIMGISRCFYEMGRYDHAIDIGESAIEMNRHFPEVHKYVALSYKAKGDIDAAIATMTKAVLYETPWDEDNIEANKVLLMEIKQA